MTQSPRERIREMAKIWTKQMWEARVHESHDRMKMVDIYGAGAEAGFMLAVEMLKSGDAPYTGAAQMKNRSMCADWLEKKWSEK